MSYGVKYRGDFYDSDNKLCRVDICQDGYSGVINDLVFGDTPVVLKMDSANQPIYQPIKTTSIEINLFKSYFTQYDEFQNNDDKQYIVKFYVDSVLNFSGWLITRGIVEPYRSVPYILNLQVVDGINRLKDVKFVTPTTIYTRPFYGDYYYRAWRITMKEIFQQVMANLPPDYTIRSYCNLFADDNGTGYNILAGGNYINYELIKGKSVYEALEMIINSTGHKLVVEKTTVKIYSLKEQEQFAYNELVSYTDYDTNFDITGTGTETYSKLNVGTNLKLQPGGTITKNPAYKQFVIEADYGRLDNVLIPGDLSNAVVIDDNDNATIYFYEKSSSAIEVIAKEGLDKKLLLETFFNSGYNYNDNFVTLHVKLKDVPPANGTRGRLKFKFDMKLGDTAYTQLNHYFTIINSPVFENYRADNPPFASYLFAYQEIQFYGGKWWWAYTDPSPGNYQSFPFVTNQWQTIEFDLNGPKPLDNNDIIFVIGPADKQSENESYPFQFRNITLSFYNTDENGNQVLYPAGENVTVVNNNTGLFASEPYKIELASMPDTIYGEQAYNLIHIYKSCLLIETTAPNFFEMKDVYHATAPTTLQPLQDYIGRLIAGTATISQSVVNCDLLGELTSLLAPIYNIEEPNKMYFIGSCSYDFKRKRGKYELLQYVPYVGDDWDRILTEDGYLVLAENDDELITEKNYI